MRTGSKLHSTAKKASDLLFTLFIATGVTFAQKPALPPNVELVESLGGISQYRLKSNDMTILLSQNHAAPVITFMVVYHVGSRNEAPGNTGSAHLLEHMIFNKSTENFGHAKGHKNTLSSRATIDRACARAGESPEPLRNSSDGFMAFFSLRVKQNRLSG